MRRLRVTIGVGLLSALVLILGSGFMARSSHDMLLAIYGFAAGLVCVYAIERLQATRR
jgi:hypothetical protein